MDIYSNNNNIINKECNTVMVGIYYFFSYSFGNKDEIK